MTKQLETTNSNNELSTTDMNIEHMTVRQTEIELRDLTKLSQTLIIHNGLFAECEVLDFRGLCGPRTKTRA